MVFIESIKIENFRGIEKGEVKGLEKVNILLGANGAGKSTILESIYLASAWANPIDELRGLRKEDYVVSRRTGRGVWSSTRDVLWYKMDTDREVKISINFRETNASMDFVVPYHVSGVVSGESYVFLKPPHNIIETHGVPLNTVIYISSFPVCRLFKPIEGVFSGVLSDKARGLLNKLYGKAIAVLKNVVFIDSTFMRNPRFIEERLWSKLLSKRLDKEVVRVLREGYEVSVEDLTYAPLPSGEYMLFLKLPDTSIGIDSLGDGARNAVALLAALVLARDTVVLIEDPEVHQHPHGLGVLMKAVLSIAKKNDLQLITSTQSIEFAKIMLRLCRDMRIPVRIFFVEREHGVLQARVLKELDVDVLMKLGIDPRFLEAF